LLIVRDGLKRRGILPQITHHNEVSDQWNFAGELFDHGKQVVINKDYGVLRTVDDVLEIVGAEGQIQRVQDSADTGHGVIELKVTVAVPPKRRNSIASPDAKSRK